MCLLQLFSIFLLSTCATVDDNDILKDERFKYSNVLKVHHETKRPMVVVIGAKWCGPCVGYKDGTVRQFAKDIIDGKSDYLLAIIDVDDEPCLAQQHFGINSGDSSSVQKEKSMIPFTAIYSFEGGRCAKRSFRGNENRDFLNGYFKFVEENRDKPVGQNMPTSILVETETEDVLTNL